MPSTLSMLGLGPGGDKEEPASSAPMEQSEPDGDEDDKGGDVSDEQVMAAEDVMKALRGGGKDAAKSLARALRAFVVLDEG